MSVCTVCGQQKMVSPSCIKLTVKIAGRDYDPVPWGSRPEETVGRCPGCGVEKGGYHHPGCDYEICPRCGQRMMICGCEEI